MHGRCFCVSFASPYDIHRCLRIGQSVMLDNGAFSVWRRGIAPDWPAYYDWVEDKLNHPQLGNCARRNRRLRTGELSTDRRVATLQGSRGGRLAHERVDGSSRCPCRARVPLSLFRFHAGVSSRLSGVGQADGPRLHHLGVSGPTSMGSHATWALSGWPSLAVCLRGQHERGPQFQAQWKANRQGAARHGRRNRRHPMPSFLHTTQ